MTDVVAETQPVREPVALPRTPTQVERILEGFGEFCLFAWQTFLYTASAIVRPHTMRGLLTQMYEVGVKSVPVVGITGAFIGMVMAIESYAQFVAIGQEERIGSVIGLTVVKQIGPVLAAMMLAGRVGGALTAELGTMNVTEQLDALRVMGSDPIRYLVVPRFLACLILTPILTVYSDYLGILGGWIVATKALGISDEAYWQNSAFGIETWQVMEGLFKSVFFGGAIGLISCYKGFTCGSGASGVGKACTEGFVQSFIAIIILNFFFAKLLRDIYEGRFGPPESVF
ncbi:MAG: ABC transporter permease [Planctomycetota bacterium]